MSISINDNFFKIREESIYNRNAVKDIRISALGDIHLSENLVTGKKLDAISFQLERQNPNYIFLLGDIIDDPEVLENTTRRKELTTFLKNTSSIAPTMLILGSHDYVKEINGGENWYNKEYWEGEISNIKDLNLLNNDIYNDNTLLVMGYFEQMPYYYNLVKENKEDSESLYNDLINRKELYTGLPNDVPKIALFHSGICFENQKVINLLNEYSAIFCGHAHNGCVPIIADEILRFKNLKNLGIISPKKQIMPKNVRGIVNLKVSNRKIIPLINSGGIIKIQECAPKIIQLANYICPMQMDIMTITSDKEKANNEKSRYVKVRK